MTASANNGPLTGLKVVEMQAIGPGPHVALCVFCGTIDGPEEPFLAATPLHDIFRVPFPSESCVTRLVKP